MSKRTLEEWLAWQQEEAARVEPEGANFSSEYAEYWQGYSAALRSVQHYVESLRKAPRNALEILIADIQDAKEPEVIDRGYYKTVQPLSPIEGKILDLMERLAVELRGHQPT